MVLLTDAIVGPRPEGLARRADRAGTRAAHSMRKTVELVREMQHPALRHAGRRSPRATSRAATASSRPASCSTWCRPPTAPGRGAARADRRRPSSRTTACCCGSSSTAWPPHEGLTKIEPVVRRIVAPPRAGHRVQDLRLLRPAAAAHPGGAARACWCARSPGPGDLEIVELAVDQPVHVAADKIHRAPDGTWSAQGLSLVADPRTPPPRFTLPGARARAHGRRPRHRAGSTRATPRCCRSASTSVRRALEAATDSGTREDKIHALNLDYAARGLDVARGGAAPALARAPSARASPRSTSCGPRRTWPSTRACASGSLEPRVQLVTLRQGRRAPGARARARRCGSAATASWCASIGAGRPQGRAARALLRPRALAARPEDDPARRVPAGVPLPPQPPAGRQLVTLERMSGRDPDGRRRRARAAARGALPAARAGPRAGGALGARAVRRARPGTARGSWCSARGFPTCRSSRRSRRSARAPPAAASRSW